jgi:probable rRNA maturation factor
MTVELNNESDVGLDEDRLLALAQFVLDRMRVHPLAELSIMLYDEPAMAELHEEHMDEPGATDVMAFPMDELRPGDDDREPEPGLLGDVVICPSVAARQAVGAGHAVDDELDLLCTHGILHLLGYDHHDPDEEREMFGLQARLLAQWQGHRTATGGQA